MSDLHIKEFVVMSTEGEVQGLKSGPLTHMEKGQAFYSLVPAGPYLQMSQAIRLGCLDSPVLRKGCSRGHLPHFSLQLIRLASQNLLLEFSLPFHFQVVFR